MTEHLRQIKRKHRHAHTLNGIKSVCDNKNW